MRSDRSRRPPSDQAARDAVTSQLGDTMFVEAGAGSGKTTVLVDRVCNLVESGVPITAIAAITFTEKAAAELRSRVREELTSRPSSPSIDEALGSLGDAPISTLHSFARRVLTEHGLVVGVPPRFEVRDEVGEAIDFDERWRALAGDLFDPAGALAPAVERAVELGLTPRQLREIVVALHQSYDRLHPVDVPWSRPSSRVVLPSVDLSDLVAAVKALSPEPDSALAAYLRRAETATTDAARLDVLRTEDVLPTHGSGVRKAARDARANTLKRVRRDALTAIRPTLAATVLEWADERRRDGRLSFHDLLVLARDALRDEAVRSACHERYQRVLIDEFQDTDPLQIEIAVLLASSRPDIADVAWHDHPLTPDDAGHLFFVGDPKQSIYRFRRADIDLYRRAQTVFGERPMRLTENFRTVASIVDYVNELFEEWMAESPHGTQPDYVALTPYIADHDDDVSVMAVGDEVPGATTVEVRALEADAVVRVVAQAKREGWTIRDGGELRPAQYSDIAVLMPTRATLPALDNGLDVAGIPARVESRSLMWNTPEVRDLMAVLSAVSDPNDEVATVAALRSPGLACSDLDLATWRWARGWWSYLSKLPEDLEPGHPVARAFGVLKELHNARWTLSIGELVRRVIDVCHLRELAFAHARPRDRWRRIDFLLGQARAFEAAGGTSIEEFVSWGREQSEREVWVNDAIAPDRDDDAVRILTVHASKGLEFPIVILMGLNARPSGVGPAVLWSPTGPELKAGPAAARFETDGYGGLWERESEAFDAERVRLAYVAMTRARDHLIVSLFRPQPGKNLLATDIANHGPTLEILDAEPLSLAFATTNEQPSSNPDDRAGWIAARALDIVRLGRSPAIAATKVQLLQPPPPDAAPEGETPGLAEADIVEPAAEEQPPWRRGRAGTAIGRAVHAVLQTVDLATGEGADTLSVAQAAAEGVPALASEIERRVRSVLQAPTVKEAVATGKYWREVFLAAPVEGRVLEGFIDLLYEDTAGELVVVDYKTDGVRTDEDADEAVARYRLQGAAYALAVSSSLNRPVSRCVFVFANLTRWFERELPDLEVACGEVAGLVASG